MDNEVKVNIKCDSSQAVKQLERATKAAEKLVIEMKKLQDIKINLTITNTKPKWWQFWE